MKPIYLLVFLGASALAGCSTLACGDPHPYADAQARPALVTPPGLTAPTPDSTYVMSVPPPSGKRTDVTPAGTCLIQPPQVVASPAAAKRGSSTHKPATSAAGTSPSAQSATSTSASGTPKQPAQSTAAQALSAATNKPASIAAPPSLG